MCASSLVLKEHRLVLKYSATDSIVCGFSCFKVYGYYLLFSTILHRETSFVTFNLLGERTPLKVRV